MASDVCELIRPRVDHKDIEVLLRVGDAVPSQVVGDPYRFKQVLVIDDNWNNLEIMKHILASADIRVVVRSSGEETLPVVQTAHAGGGSV